MSEHKGFSDNIYCTRVHHTVTIYNPFDEPFVAAIADELMMVIEEFMMPMAVQDIGNIEVTTFDEREGKLRPIDVIDLKSLTTHSGAILKLSEVKVNNFVTSLTDRTYFFHY